MGALGGVIPGDFAGEEDLDPVSEVRVDFGGGELCTEGGWAVDPLGDDRRGDWFLGEEGVEEVVS